MSQASTFQEENQESVGWPASGNGHRPEEYNAQTLFNDPPPPSSKTHQGGGLVWESKFTKTDPYAAISWEKRTARITKSNGQVVFEQKNVEVPDFWSQTATDIVASKYFRRPFGSAEKESSARQMVDRVADTISGWGWKDGYFATEQDYLNFGYDLKWLLINQYGAFNSPVWFNVGVYERPQSSACQPYHALISTPFGFYKMGEIVENNLVGLPVYDSSGITKVVAVKNSGIKKVYKVILRNGTFVEATGDHLVKAVHERRTKPAWVRLEELKKGMRLQLYPHHKVFEREQFLPSYAYQSASPIVAGGGLTTGFLVGRGLESQDSNTRVEISEAALAGWLQADGFVGQYSHGTNNSLTIEFLVVNKEEEEWLESHLNVVFPHMHRKTRITKTKAGTSITRIRLYGEVLRDFVERYELLKRGTKIRTPQILWKSNPEVMAAYLKSIFQGEGYVSTRGRSVHVALATISKEWMNDLQILLYGLGIYSRVHLKKEKREDRFDLYELSVNVGSERKRFAKLIGFVDGKKRLKLLTSLKIKEQKNILNLREEEILDIQLVGEETVYDIQTQSGEYLTNNVAVHNCFILAVEDNMQSILEWYRDEGWIFKYGSGAGTNLSKLRSSKEPLSRGGHSSGPVSFMKGADGIASSIRSGGETRRAAKMVVLNVDHPDIKDFIYCKKVIEDMTKALVQSGIKDSITADLFDPYALLPYQNANNSVRVTDEFMRAVENDEEWELKAVTTGEVLEKVRAREVIRWIADAAWHSADPGMQYDTTINNWHTCPKAGRINASNPCVTGDTLVATASGLKPIKQLVGTQPLIKTTHGYHKAKRVWQTGVKPVFKLTTKSGYSLKVTGDHRFFVENKGDIAAKDLKRGDLIPLLGAGFGNKNLKNSLALAVGYAIGDGCISHQVTRGSSALTWVGGQEDASVLQQIARGINYYSSGVDSWGRSISPVQVHASTPGLKVVTSRPAIVSLLSKYAILDRGSEHKRFTEEAFELDKKSLAMALKGLFTADGTISGNAEKGYYVGLDSTSMDLLQQVQLFLLNFDIKSKLYLNRRTKFTAYLPDANRNKKIYPVKQIHSLRITRSSRVQFERMIGFVLGTAKAEKLKAINRTYEAYQDKMKDEFESIALVGVESVYDLTEPATSHFVANGLLVHNCSEYMHLDNSACNLTSLNLLKFLQADGTFGVDLYKKAIDTFILAQDILIDNSSYPTPKITENARRFRELGLGYANLGALLMTLGIPYDSDQGRALAGLLTSILTGEGYRMSAEISKAGGPFRGYAVDREGLRSVIWKHLRAAEDLKENLDKSDLIGDDYLKTEAVKVWKEAWELGEQYGYRNSQTTVLAPTGTISFLMDCVTTGIEPELALVKYKKLVGGGTLKLVNSQVTSALKNLGYQEGEIDQINRYLLEKETIEGAPGLKDEHRPVFDCSFKALNGQRSIHYLGHIKMMAAAQPFISGAISKTVNLPKDTTVEEIERAFIESWRAGLKAVAFYRDESKTIQPLNTSDKKDGLVEKINGYIRVKLPDTRPSITHKFSVGGYEGYLTIGLYPDTKKVGETFIRIAKEGSTVSGLLDVVATLTSISLQSGVPLKVLVRKFKDMRFEPSGFTSSEEVPMAKSIIDYIFRFLGQRFLTDAEKEEVFGTTMPGLNNGLPVAPVATFVSSASPLHTVLASTITTAEATVCECGTIMVKAGSCYSCPNCFTTTGACN